MENKTIWYVSKYAGSPNKPGPVRQYYYSKYLAINGYNVNLISSNSNGFEYIPMEGLYVKKQISKNFYHYIINGPEISLGFNFKRIYSWLVFEWNLIKFFKQNKPRKNDIVITSSLSILSFLTGIYLKKKYGTKLIVEIRDIWPESLISLKGVSRYNPFVLFLSLIEKAGYKHADAIIGSMPNLKEHVEKINPSYAQKVFHVPTGYDRNEKKIIFPKSDKLKKFYACYAGSIGNANRVELILKAAELLEDYPDIRFKILGDGPLKRSLHEKYAYLKNIKFFKPVSKDKVPCFLSFCDVLLMPVGNLPVYQYGISPNKLIDYLQLEKPVIVPYNGNKMFWDKAECIRFIEADNPGLLAETILDFYTKRNNNTFRQTEQCKDFLENELSYDILVHKLIDIIEKI